MDYYGRLGRKVEIFWDKISLTSCKWPSFNASGTETPVSHQFLADSLFIIISSWVLRNGSPLYIDQDGVKIWEQNLFNRLQMDQFECARH